MAKFSLARLAGFARDSKLAVARLGLDTASLVLRTRKTQFRRSNPDARRAGVSLQPRPKAQNRPDYIGAVLAWRGWPDLNR